MKMKK